MKTYLTIIVTLFALMINRVYAQDCPQNISFTIQEEIDNFPSNFPNCTEIPGNLFLDGGVSDSNINNLDSLHQIISVEGTLGFFDTDYLVSLSGLENLNSIGGGLIAWGVDNLVNFSGLENLNSIGGNLGVSDAYNLVDFSGLENLNSIGGEVSIWSANNLVDFSGIDNLTSIGGDLRISNTYQLVSFSGLENLNFIGGGLHINNNNLLTDISAIENIDYSIINDLTIRWNENLSVCSAESICAYLVVGGTALIENNAEGCNAVAEVVLSCVSLFDYLIEGNVFADISVDCSQDMDESGLDNWLIKIEQEGQPVRYTYTFSDGNYVALADSGAQYTLTAIPPNMLWDNICPVSDSIFISTDTPYNGVVFGATGSISCPLLEVDIASPIVRRCFDSNYYVRYCNSGTAIAENAYVEVQLDPFFIYQNSTIAGIDLGENLYSFDLENVDIGACGNFRIDVYVDCDSTQIGQAHCVEAHIYPDSICTSALPIWDGASIRVDAQCLDDSIEFKIENIGTGDMSDSLEYMVIEEDLIYQRANFQLNSGENKTFYKQANGLFHRLESEQSPGHPGNSMPSVFVEGCGVDGNGEISIGFINYFLLDEGDAYVSIDCQENVGSYDPNDKQAFPVGYGAPHYITDSTDLEYMIRFQNTGTDTAFTVVIRDTISPHLNIETLRPGVASHDYRYDIEESNIAVFHFENIMLPDSNVNEAASHGFIKFNIEQNRDNPIGTHIMNDAAIYFDFNEPIITNTVFHTVGEDFMGLVTSIITPPEVLESGISVNVFPNPFDEYTRFEVEGETVKELHLSLYDMMGREVLQQQSTHQQHLTIKRNNLTPGVYVFRLMDEKQQLATGKLVIK